MTQLLDDYQALTLSQPKIRMIDAANELKVSEGELIAAHVGQTNQLGAIRLNDDLGGIIKSLKKLGRVMALMRNEFVVSEISGCYEKIYISNEDGKLSGIAINPGGIDLRFFFEHWHSTYAVTSGKLSSIQFFDRHGVAIQKVYLKDEGTRQNYDDLITKYRHVEQNTELSVSPQPTLVSDALDDTAVEISALTQGWSEMTDVHQFPALLKKHNVGRRQALRLIDDQWAKSVDVDCLSRLLELAKEKETQVMAFVGNRGIVQIFSGLVDNLKAIEGWYNVLDPDFNLHVKTQGLAEAYVVNKPTDQGGVMVSSVEFFNQQGETVLTFFGRRTEGKTQSPQWHQIIAELSSPICTPVS